MKKLTALPADDLIQNTRIFHEYITDLGMDNGWGEGNQQENFEYLSRIASLANTSFTAKSVLDVGCGTGDLSKYLRPLGISGYVGIDIYEPSLDVARERYPQETFIQGDLLQDVITQTFDFAFCSGGLTLNLTVNNYDFLYSMVQKMWELTTIGVAFNILTDDDDDPDSDLFFYNPERVIEICQMIAPEGIISAVKTPDLCQIHVYMYRETV